jgi:ABC-type multidrug transport system fused ATPase/permease subunit
MRFEGTRMSDNKDAWRGVVSEEKRDPETGKLSALLRAQSRQLLGGLLWPYKKELAWTTILMLVSLGAWLAEPPLVGAVFDKGIDTGNTRALYVLIGVMVAVFIVNEVAFGLFVYISGRMGQDVLLDLRRKVFGKFQELSINFHEKYTSGRVVARLTSDVDALSELLHTGFQNVLINVLAVFGIIGVMFWTDWRLALFAMTVFPMVIGLTFWFRKHSERTYRRVREAVALVIIFYNESLGGIRAGKAFRREHRNKDIFESVTARYRDANIDSAVLAAKFSPGVRWLGRLSQAIVLFVGAFRVASGVDPLSIGELIAFLLLVDRFFGPLQDLSQFYNVFKAASAAMEKLAGVLEEPNSVAEPEDPVTPEFVHGEVALENVEFWYREGTPVLHTVNLHVPAGQTVALVGETGAGKSTLAKLFSRMYDPSEGRVTLDGIDLRRFPEWRLRRAVAMVTQESFLFSGTVAENIGFGRPDATREEIIEACKVIGAHEFIDNLQKGYDTDVKKRGGRLSSGQRQLIAFARAFLADPSVLILDEATSSLDIPTERLVQHALRTLLSDRTAFIIAHRLTTVEIADRVLVIDDGRIVEDGTPADLMSGTGAYADLHAAWLESVAT